MEMIKVPQDVNLKQIYIDIHCIGRNPQGEGIIFIIRKNDYIIFSASIDGNADERFLKDEGIDKFNLVCWTHPHDDHSIGIKKILKNHVQKNTKIIVPNGIYDAKKYMTHMCKSVYKPIKVLNKNGKNRDGEYVEVNQYSILQDDVYVDEEGKKLKLKIEVLSPISKRINNIRNNKKINLNELSICLLISVNDVCFLFTSDIYNNIINDMNLNIEKCRRIIFYKIPHHGSDRSDALLKSIPQSQLNRIAVSTIFKVNGQDKTPNKNLLDKYIEKGINVFCTSESYIKNSKKEFDYGIVSIRIKLENLNQEESLDWDIRLTGEATQIEQYNN